VVVVVVVVMCACVCLFVEKMNGELRPTA
jgi:hypothetical protein